MIKPRYVAAGLLLLALFLPATQGYGVTLRQKKAQVEDLKDRVARVQDRADQATEEYQDAQARLANTENELTASQTRLALATSQLAGLQKILDGRVDNLYRHGKIDVVEVIFGVRSFDEFLDRWEWLRRIGAQDAKLVTSVKLYRQQVQGETEQLRVLQARRRVELREAQAAATDLQARLGDLEDLYRKSKKQLAVLIKAEKERRARLAAARRAAAGNGLAADIPTPVNGYYFPVAGAHSFTNDWGEPRSGGRSHQGTDVFAAMGAPSVAVTGGMVHTEYNNGNAGHSVHLYGDDGVTYKYFHMSGFAVSGGRVKAGQVIAYVGDTGNAKGTPPHLHFEVHPGEGGPVNPYPFLQAWEAN